MSAPIAAWLQSDAGRMYGIACERWMVDPGAAFGDDVLGHQVRMGLVLNRVDPEGEATIYDDGRRVVHNPGLAYG